MHKTKEIYPGAFYIFESKAAANSNYIENLREAKQLLIYANHYLKSYLKIHDYIITRHGWQFAISINKDFPSHQNQEPWRVVSERIRLFLSTYVRYINHHRNRTGVLVQKNYIKYYFETWKEAKSHLDRMRTQQIRLYQRKRKYRGLKFHYKISKKKEIGSIFLCSKALIKMKSILMDELRIQHLWALKNFVGPKLVEITKNLHKSTNHHKTHQNSS